MKRKILLVDDEVTVLLTLKAVLEISGFDVDTAASAKEGKSKLRSREYHMVISDMRMENDAAGAEVIQAARSAPYHPAVALLTAYPVDEESWEGAGPDKVLIKATHTRILLQQIDKLFASHAAKLSRLAVQAGGNGAPNTTGDVQSVGAKKGVSRAPKASEALSMASQSASQPGKTSA